MFTAAYTWVYYVFRHFQEVSGINEETGQISEVSGSASNNPVLQVQKLVIHVAEQLTKIQPKHVIYDTSVGKNEKKGDKGKKKDAYLNVDWLYT